jgi:hypothetical protein
MMTEDQLTALEHRLAVAGPDDLGAMAAEWLASAWPTDGQSPAFDPALAVSLDKALQLTVETFPNWAITLQGTAHPTIGQWSCTLRKSGLRDDYEMIGIGNAPTAPLAMMMALLRVMIRQAKAGN